MEKIIGKHYAPQAGTDTANWETISVGISEVLPRSSKKGSKLGPAKVRVTGYNTEYGVLVLNRLSEIVAHLLDEGQYQGPKNLKADSKFAKQLLGELL